MRTERLNGKRTGKVRMGDSFAQNHIQGGERMVMENRTRGISRVRRKGNGSARGELHSTM